MTAIPTNTREAFKALNSVVTPLVKMGVGSPLPWGGVGLILLETTGAKSGKIRQVPLLGLRIGRRVLVSTVRQNSHWVNNLLAHPTADVWLNGRSRPVVSSISDGPLTTVRLDLKSDA